MSEPTRRQKLEALLAHDPNDPFLKYALAMECAAQGDDHAAVDWFQRLTREHPDYIAGYHQYGKLLLRLGHQRELRRCCGEGLQWPGNLAISMPLRKWKRYSPSWLEPPPR